MELKIGRGTGLFLAACGLLAAVIGVALRPLLSTPDVPVLDVGKDFPVRDAELEDSGLCPWREPQADLTRFFPAIAPHSRIREETLVLTRQRPLVAQLLGRTPTGQENAIQLHRVYAEARLGGQNDPARLVGTIVTRFVRGESGVIELVLAVDARERVIGARLQRLREPESVARELQSARFLRTFQGRTFASDWDSAPNFAGISADTHISAQAVLEGARTALVLLHIGGQALAERRHSAPSH